MTKEEIYNELIKQFENVDKYPKNQPLWWIDEGTHEVKVIHYEDPIIMYRNDLTPIRSSEIL